MTNRRDQFLVQALEMCLCRFQQRLAKRLDILRIEAEFRHLKLQKVQQLLDTRLHRDRTDMKIVASQHASDGTVVGAEKLYQRGVGWEYGSDLLQRRGR